MNGINAIRVRNLRGFGANASFIPLKDINVLVGKNSSGKSTFARIFPLLRQSLEENTKGPVLWYGDYVDFGDFSSAVNRNEGASRSEEIIFDFDMTVDLSSITENEAVFIDDDQIRLAEESLGIEFDIKVSLGVSQEEGKTLASRVLLDIDGAEIEFNIEKNKVKSIFIRDTSIELNEEIECDAMVSESSFIPFFLEKSTFTIGNKKYSRYIRKRRLTSAKNKFVSFLQEYHHQSKKTKNITRVVELLKFEKEQGLYQQISNHFKSDSQFKKNILNCESKFSRSAFIHHLCMNVNGVFECANSVLKSTFLGVRYLGPIRATAQRFYRYQDLQVNEIDHTGSNLPMLLNNLSDTERVELQEWMTNSFGFTFEPQNQGSHFEILIREEKSENSFNISDMGFGYSQILPVLVAIWIEKYSRNNRRFNGRYRLFDDMSSIIVIEQPELHLHPELQYKFAKAISYIASQKGDIRFIFETHSKHIIDALGESIRLGEAKRESVNIVIFEKSPSGSSQVKEAGFDNDGYLENWPLGFLSV